MHTNHEIMSQFHVERRLRCLMPERVHTKGTNGLPSLVPRLLFLFVRWGKRELCVCAEMSLFPHVVNSQAVHVV